MVDTGELERYLNDKSAKKGDVVEILDEGEFGEVPDKETHEMKKVLNIGVRNGNLKLIWTPGKTAMRAVQKVWGLDTKNWVGKKGTVEFMKMSSFGDMKDVLILMPITESKA